MVEAAESLGAPYHVGVTLSVDSDFVGGGRPGVGGTYSRGILKQPESTTGPVC